jgi:hypothetical protein
MKTRELGRSGLKGLCRKNKSQVILLTNNSGLRLNNAQF